MPIHQNNLLEQAQTLYKRVIEELVTDIPIEDGMFRPQLNFSELVRLVKEQPKAAQGATQMLAQVKEEEDKEQARLHGTWFMMALIVAFGKESEVVRYTRMVAHDFYDLAIAQIKDQFGA